ncbi:hypothetical protein EC08BKT55439_2442 [Escherichia coli 08BKT055439]|nr:PapX protein [Escherichia coli O157:H7 str. EDL933]EFW62555.1 PapX protein [Escherichia coli O157:H7 str. EC1212]EGD60975.1 PapX protein [Escherichia coli O157:H7 str. 1125]EGD71356.1 PapX protein [Escherichia coli O157:H7 str. 1044]EHU61790.1 papX protein [Escherichia coli DEC3B]EHU75178.1 papX protein [Escherichia coli DEC3D]EHU76685.1 papX protein [Escherichia coli DEC3C]EHU90934.1 papX protein [Escherichia coli DEC4B]EHU93253.1 papX protein [Escherichia coli DEC4A]EHV09147.1 papX pr
MESKEDRRSKNIYLTSDGNLYLQRTTRIYGRYLKKYGATLQMMKSKHLK